MADGPATFDSHFSVWVLEDECPIPWYVLAGHPAVQKPEVRNEAAMKYFR